MSETQSQLTQILAELADLKGQVATLAKHVNDMNGILETWQAFKTGGQIITWMAKVATAILAVIVFLKLGLASLLKDG